MTRVTVVLVAAGKGERLGAGVPKALAKVAGKTLLERAAEQISAISGLRQVVIAAPAEHVEEFLDLVSGQFDASHLSVVAGGGTRQQSIAAALAWLDRQDFGGDDVILVHDAARCYASTALFERVALAVTESGAGVIPVLPVVDTIKRASGTDILETIDRSHLRVAQTPQGFPAHELLAAYAATGEEHTDDASLYQAAGGRVVAVLGEAAAYKITTPDDLQRAERENSQLDANYRSGIGTDVHRFTADSSGVLKLAGIDWPGEPALEGHSDGDAVAHATVDALLAAAGLGDIGGVFGVDRPEFQGASGAVFIAHTLELLKQNHWTVVNVSVQIVGNRPKLAPRRSEAEASMTKLVGAPVSIGATTTDGLGFLGNSEGVAAVATALIRRASQVG